MTKTKFKPAKTQPEEVQLEGTCPVCGYDITEVSTRRDALENKEDIQFLCPNCKAPLQVEY